MVRAWGAEVEGNLRGGWGVAGERGRTRADAGRVSCGVALRAPTGTIIPGPSTRSGCGGAAARLTREQVETCDRGSRAAAPSRHERATGGNDGHGRCRPAARRPTGAGRRRRGGCGDRGARAALQAPLRGGVLVAVTQFAAEAGVSPAGAGASARIGSAPMSGTSPVTSDHVVDGARARATARSRWSSQLRVRRSARAPAALGRDRTSDALVATDGGGQDPRSSRMMCPP